LAKGGVAFPSVGLERCRRNAAACGRERGFPLLSC
jgi:hypothetical protein